MDFEKYLRSKKYLRYTVCYFRSTRYKSDYVFKWSFDINLILFLIFNVSLSTVDLGTDSYQAYVYYIKDHKNWSYATISIVFVPILTRCMSEIIRNLIKKRENRSLIESIKKIAGNLPIFQQIIYCCYLKHLKVAKDQKLKSLEFYKSFDPKTVSEKDLEAYQQDVSKAADDFVKADNDYLKLMTEFQQIKLFDTFGESAPQAALQISIVLQDGNLSAIQVITIATSFLSLALGKCFTYFTKTRANLTTYGTKLRITMAPLFLRLIS